MIWGYHYFRKHPYFSTDWPFSKPPILRPKCTSRRGRVAIDSVGTWHPENFQVNQSLEFVLLDFCWKCVRIAVQQVFKDRIGFNEVFSQELGHQEIGTSETLVQYFQHQRVQWSSAIALMLIPQKSWVGKKNSIKLLAFGSHYGMFEQLIVNTGFNG